MTKRRAPGEGGVSEYVTARGTTTFYISYWVTDPETGRLRRKVTRGFPTKKEAHTRQRAELGKADRGEWVDPSKEQLAAYLQTWLAGQRLRPSTLSSYKKNVRLHIAPRLGSTPLARITGAQVNAWLRDLEQTGRADGAGGLSARTTRYVFTILRSALSDAVRDGRLAVNPTDRATPPTAAEARPPEMRAWTATQLRTFLGWSAGRGDDLHVVWLLLASTGMRRGEALALRWRDVDLDAATVAVRRSVGVVKTYGAGQDIVEGPTKSGHARVVDLDAATVAALRGYRVERGGIALGLIRDDALVLGAPNGLYRHPDRVSRTFRERIAQCRRALGDDALPTCRLHDLRHTHASLLLADGVPVKVVSERLGHANATITLGVYQHVMPGMGRQAADRFAALLGG